jgi:hypothetical protein
VTIPWLPWSTERTKSTLCYGRSTRSYSVPGWVFALATQTELVAEYLTDQADGQNPRIVQMLERWIQYRLYANLIPEGHE